MVAKHPKCMSENKILYIQFFFPKYRWCSFHKVNDNLKNRRFNCVPKILHNLPNALKAFGMESFFFLQAMVNQSCPIGFTALLWIPKRKDGAAHRPMERGPLSSVLSQPNEFLCVRYPLEIRTAPKRPWKESLDIEFQFPC